MSHIEESPHIFSSEVHVSHNDSRTIGDSTLQLPLHKTVHIAVSPQAFALLVQVSQKVETGSIQLQSSKSDGAIASHVPSHCTTPDPIVPQLFA